MAGRIPQSFIDELIARTDIVEVVGSRVQLKKAGREWKAPCPFHNEKTPSFWVSPDKQFYHCFGCGAHGTALGFLMEHDKLPFPDAVEELAGRLGLEVPREDDGRGPRERPGEDLYELLGQVTQYYRDCLRDAPRARDYLKRRGLTTESCVRFGIGYAPDAWDAVLRRFGGSPEKVQRLAEAGLVIERSGGRDAGHYDRFRDRVMFPIRDLRGRTIAFGGRIIDAGEPKYLNSPETPLFHKGRELYGLYEARQSLRSIDRLLVVEGYMDVVRLAQAGIAYSVATLGTATTPEHLNRLFRVCGEVVFCFDGDRAGRTAAWRALENALGHAREGRQLRFLFLPEGQDPDSLVGDEGAEAFEARIAAAMPLSEYLVGQLAAQVDRS
jgi:DNA primase